MPVVSDRSVASTIADSVIVIVLIIGTVLSVFPILYVLSSSFSRLPGLIPNNVTLDAYQYVFGTRTFVRSLIVSIYITSVGTLISLTLTALTAYGLSDKSLPGRGGILFLVIFTLLFNGGIIPTYFVVRATGLLDTLWAIMIPNAINAFNLVVIKNFFQTIPTDLRESAKMDGAHELRILAQIIVPLSVPALAAFGLFYAVERWNLYFQAILYIRDSAKWPVQVLLRQVLFVSSGALSNSSANTQDTIVFSSAAIESAVIVVSTLPILLLYPFLQKHFVKGLLIGSIKG